MGQVTRKPTVGLVLALVAALGGGIAEARTVHLPGDAATLQAAIDSTANGDTVLVAAGRYTGPGNRDVQFFGKSIVVRSVAGAAATIVDVQGSAAEPHRGFLFGAQEPPECILDGFTIENGYMSTLPSRRPHTAHDLSAGGIKIQDSSPTIRNCVIRNCSSEFTGGGMSVELLSSPRIEDCVIQGCSGGVFGGGISIETISSPVLVDCVITGNRASNGGGVALLADARLEHCTIADNAVAPGGLGAGIVVDFPARVSLDRSIVWGNCAATGEGEIYVAHGSQLTLACSVFDSQRTIALGTLSSTGANVEQAPGFCFPLACAGAPQVGGDYTLQAGSPCLATASPCGQQIGPRGLGCPQQTPVSAVPWGRFKSLYRSPRRSP